MRAPSLFLKEAYLVQLDRLRSKARERGRSSEPTSEGVSLSELRGGDHTLCALLAREVQRGEYRFAPLKQSRVVLDGKRRTIHRPELLDALVLGAMSARLGHLLESVLPDCVHAYRPGRSARLVLERLRAYLAEHRARLPTKQRGLFVLQRDLSAYGESIPTHADSPLWPLVERLLARLEDRREAKVLHGLLLMACRPEVRSLDGRVAKLGVGLPTGSPVQQPLQNLYLTELDERLAARDAFYARFGDDLLIATPRLPAAEAAERDAASELERLGLRLNAQKSKNTFFTGAGRPHEGQASLSLSPASHLEYLGARLDFHGHLGFTRKRARQLLQRSRWRIENAARLAPEGARTQCVAGALEQALRGEGLRDPAVEALRTWVDDRAQLRQLDQKLGLLCAEALSRKRGVRAFRHTRLRDLREAGLSSLLELRRRRRAS